MGTAAAARRFRSYGNYKVLSFFLGYEEKNVLNAEPTSGFTVRSRR